MRRTLRNETSCPLPKQRSHKGMHLERAGSGPRSGFTPPIGRVGSPERSAGAANHREASMHKTWRGVILTAALPILAASAVAPAAAQEALGEGMTIYMQMGGTEGDGATLPRTNGARAAAQALGVADLIEQYSGWLPEQMLNHFREALAADPDCIVIMGHPGSGAFADLVADAEERGIVVTSGNAPLTELFEQYQADGFGYAGVELYAGGWLTGKQMVEVGGLKE